MGKNSGSYKFEKRRKELARQKKQEEKRQRQIQKKQDKLTDLQTPMSEDPAVSPIPGENRDPLF